MAGRLGLVVLLATQVGCPTVDVQLCDLVIYRDEDGDGFGTADETDLACEPPEGWSWYGDDCDDADPDISPDEYEHCNGWDDDCDGAVDEYCR